ncbi:MAG: membrane protein insertase YidC [Enterovibrio sp.]
MDSQRNILLIALLFVSFILFNKWNEETAPAVNTAQQTVAHGDVPAGSTSSDTLLQTSSSGKLVTIATDTLTLTVDTHGGDIVRAVLNQYDGELDSAEKFVLLDNAPAHIFTAQSGLIGADGIDTAAGRAKFDVANNSFALPAGEQTLRVPLTLEKDGVLFTKTFVLTAGSYVVDVEYHIDNKSAKPASVQMYAQLKQTVVDSGGSLAMPTYRGGVYSADKAKYEKYSFDDMQERSLNLTFVEQGWAGMMQHYFATAWLPKPNSGEVNLFTRVSGGQAFIGLRYPAVTVAAGSSETLSAKLWVGPKLQDQMAQAAPNLNLTIDYGWLWFIASPLHWLLSSIQWLVGNWGLAIILLTFIVRGVMFPLTKAQYTSMAKMRMLQPKLQEMKERIGEDRQRMSQEMMELYRKEKVNPLGGCLPLLLQMPIFIALYWALMESVELRHAPFMLWINDLSAQDPYYVLPLLMGASMFVIQKMSPSTVTEPMQQKVMTFMPVIFTGFFLWFPSGLVLYWLVSNIVTLIQQTIIFRSLERKGLHKRA